MDIQSIIAIGSLLIALVSLITGFILQREQKKIRDLENINEKIKKKLTRTVNAIQGYLYIEENAAKEEGEKTAQYRKIVRQDIPEPLRNSFMTPSQINQMLNEL